MKIVKKENCKKSQNLQNFLKIEKVKISKNYIISED